MHYIDRNICAFKGSSVDISCSYSSQDNPITSKFWFVAVQLYPPRAVDLLKDPEFTHRVLWTRARVLHSENKQPETEGFSPVSLHIQITEVWMGQKFPWHNSVCHRYWGTLIHCVDQWFSTWGPTAASMCVSCWHIQMFQVIWSPICSTLTCHSSCLLSGQPSFVWYKNGTEIHGEISPTFRGFLHPGNSYSCAYEHHHSSPVCELTPKYPVWKLERLSLVIFYILIIVRKKTISWKDKIKLCY